MLRTVSAILAAVLGIGTTAPSLAQNGTISNESVQSLPTGRNFTDFARLTPGVTASLSFGSQINDTSYAIDAIGGGQQFFNSDGFDGYFLAGHITYQNLFELTRGEGNQGTLIFLSPRIGYVQNTTDVGSFTNQPGGATTTNYSGQTEMEWLTLGVELTFHNDSLPNPFSDIPGILSLGADFGVVGENRTFNDARTFERVDEETPIFLDMFYSFPVSDRVTIAPGFYAIFNANGEGGDDVFVGALKTTFKF